VQFALWLACVASVSARVRRESWEESNNSIGKACYAGYTLVEADIWGNQAKLFFVFE